MGWGDEGLLVRVPATSANLGPGFDALGLALTMYDEVWARVIPSGLTIEVRGEGAGDVADAAERHLVVRAMRVAFDDLGARQPPGLAVRCVNRIPHGRGLGSSAAAIVAGILAARALADAGVSADEALPLASELEGHPDNVAPCLYGGLTIAWTADRPRTEGSAAGAGENGYHGAAGGYHGAPGADEGGYHGATGADEGGYQSTAGAGTARAVRLQPAEGITPVAIIAPAPVSTELARGLLPAQVTHGDAARNAGRAALLIAALTARPEVLLDATQDWLHQDYRAPAMRATHELVGRLRAAGLPAVVSGAGPSVLALLASGQGLDRLDSIVKETGIEWRVSPLDVERQGASVAPGVPSAW